MKFLFVAILSLAGFILPATDFAHAQTPPALHVQGNHLEDPSGHIVRLLGVDRSGTQYQCVNNNGLGYGIFDGPSDAASIAAIKSWQVNAVRVPLNEDCWLGINLAPGNPYGGTAYQQAIIAFVQALNNAGMYAIVDLHYAAPGSYIATAQTPMTDADHSLDFWGSVATTFKDYPGVLFDLFNEPAIELGGESGSTVQQDFLVATTADWNCWLNGCTIPAPSGLPGAPAYPPVAYQAVGMQALLNKVRNAGAMQPVIVGGLFYTQDPTQWLKYVGSGPNQLTDSIPPSPQIIADYHRYGGCGTAASCQSQIALDQQYQWSVVQTIAQSYPVVSAEFGEHDCGTSYINAYMTFFDQNGMSYLGWAWNTASCAGGPSLISDYAGTPTTYGNGLKTHFAALIPTVTAVSPTSGLAAGGTSVTVTGTNFTGASAVKFGSTVVTSFTVNSDTSISVISPPGAGTADVTVTNFLGTSAPNANDQFAYNAPPPPPTVTGVRLVFGGPAAGPTTGGTVVVINGTNFSGVTAVHFGATSAAGFLYFTPGELTATSPAGMVGPVDITVTTPSGTSLTSTSDQFLYEPVPAVTAVSPARGYDAPIFTKVTVTGSGFSNATAVNFGANGAQSFVINSDTQITAFPPLGPGTGTLDVTVVSAAGTSPAITADKFTSACRSHDFNGDGFSDIAWRDNSSNTAGWLMNGAQITSTGGFGAIPGWQIVGQRDFNGDGKCDLLWRDGSGNLAIWLLNGLSVLQTGSLGDVPTTWTVVGTGDFNADGYGDILWQDNAGNVAIWLMNGLSVLQAGVVANVSTNWKIQGTDGQNHIFWRDSTTGTVAIWQMTGLTVFRTVSLGAVSANWQIMGIGDFNGDGAPDILWQDTNSGTVANWLLNVALLLEQSTTLGVVPSPWAIAATGDYNGDGTSDILWRNTTTGDVAVWFMDSSLINWGRVLSTSVVGNVPTTWTIQSANTN